MDYLIYILFISLFAPLLLMIFLVESRARLPIVFMLIGIFVAVFSSEINGILIGAMGMGLEKAAISVAPIVEELLKAFPILFFAVVISDKRETLFTASMATGIGFAILENAFYLVNNTDSFSLLSALIRGFGTGLMHGMCTLVVGFGMSFIRKRKKLFAVSIFALLTTAITYHAIFNMLVLSKYSVAGALLPIATYIPFFIWRHFKTGKKQSPKTGDAGALTREE